MWFSHKVSAIWSKAWKEPPTKLDSTKPGPLASVLCFRKDISN
jgi:hypothetical protein